MYRPERAGYKCHFGKVARTRWIDNGFLVFLAFIVLLTLFAVSLTAHSNLTVQVNILGYN